MVAIDGWLEFIVESNLRLLLTNANPDFYYYVY